MVYFVLFLFGGGGGCLGITVIRDLLFFWNECISSPSRSSRSCHPHPGRRRRVLHSRTSYGRPSLGGWYSLTHFIARITNLHDTKGTVETIVLRHVSSWVWRWGLLSVVFGERAVLGKHMGWVTGRSELPKVRPITFVRDKSPDKLTTRDMESRKVYREGGRNGRKKCEYVTNHEPTYESPLGDV